MTTPNIGLITLSNSQGQYLNANETFAILDALLGKVVKDKDLTAPPGAPDDGDVYIVGPSATGLWDGRDNAIAFWSEDAGEWVFITPREGWKFEPVDEDQVYRFDGTDWVLFTQGGDANSQVYQAASITSGALTLDAGDAGYFGVTLTESVETLTLAGAQPGKATVINVIWTQPNAGGKTVTKPANVRLPPGAGELVELGDRDITLGRFTSVDNGASWLYEKLDNYEVPPDFILPAITDENSTFNDEGTSTAGWTATNATMSVSGSTLRATKSSASGTGANIKQAVTLPSSGQDYILYGRLRASTASGAVVWLENSGATRLAGVWLNATDVGIYTAGQISLTGFNGATRTGATLATGINTETTTTDFAMQFDAKFGSLAVFFREGDGRWAFKGRVACTHNTPVNIAVLHLSTNASGAWVEFDFLTICKPNVVVIGDSIAEGKSLYSPNLSLGLANYNSTWTRYADIYPTLRNNLVVNKGVGGETSAQTLARIADATGPGPRVVFLHASSNDYVQGVSESARTTNITSTITSIEAAGAECVLLNAMYGTSTNTSNPAQRDYADAWWDAHSASVGAHTVIDIMLPIETAGYMNGALTQSDKIHPTPAGYQAIGEYIASS